MFERADTPVNLVRRTNTLFFLQNATLGTIDTTTASFKEKIFSNIAAVRLLEVAGFKIGTASGTSHQLILSHSNPAVLTLVMQAS